MVSYISKYHLIFSVNVQPVENSNLEFKNDREQKKKKGLVIMQILIEIPTDSTWTPKKRV